MRNAPARLQAALEVTQTAGRTAARLQNMFHLVHNVRLLIGAAPKDGRSVHIIRCLAIVAGRRIVQIVQRALTGARIRQLIDWIAETHTAGRLGGDLCRCRQRRIGCRTV